MTSWHNLPAIYIVILYVVIKSVYETSQIKLDGDIFTIAYNNLNK